MDLAEDRLVDWNGLVRVAQLLERNNVMVLKAAHKLVCGIAVRTQEVGAVGAPSHSLLFGLAAGAQHRHALDGRHVQDVGEHVVAGQGARSLAAHLEHETQLLT